MISVIIPVFNVEKYLSRCLDSILKQSYKDLEIIIVDDGSKDNSGAICDEYKAKDSRIIVIHKENGGLSSARNVGIDVCTGEFLFFIDSDDWLANDDVLSDFYEVVKHNNADFCYALFNNAYNGSIKKEVFKNRYIDNERLFLLSNPYLLTAWNKLIRKDLFSKIRFTDGRINEDVDIIPLLFSHSKQVSFLNKYTYNYFVNTESITRKTFSDKRFDMFKSVNHIQSEFKGADNEKHVLMENLYGFQLFSVFISCLKQTQKADRWNYIKKYIQLLKEYKFKHFFIYCFMCFKHTEYFLKKLKKYPILIFLFILYLFNGERKND